MDFRLWIEATVSFSNIKQAMEQSLENIVTDGQWEFTPRPYGLSGLKTVTAAGKFHSNKGKFLITANAISAKRLWPSFDEKPIDSYDSVTGQIGKEPPVHILTTGGTRHQTSAVQVLELPVDSIIGGDSYDKIIKTTRAVLIDDLSPGTSGVVRKLKAIMPDFMPTGDDPHPNYIQITPWDGKSQDSVLMPLIPRIQQILRPR